ncbi:hypothetical protein BESB_079180 [Besnoitia besnoiti]|uniref:Uncharacterized protein n=1 Tax=Besnoitia besnoiti TaxID=94643 RepID=A0A2A9ME89_BESBE|nr:hypothetical protein BESB_079180 [Besnoitia besnoiti]PFH33702.1 hypothetical protein BESB_079180 [Besnoitia besnoiti]
MWQLGVVFAAVASLSGAAGDALVRLSFVLEERRAAGSEGGEPQETEQRAGARSQALDAEEGEARGNEGSAKERSQARRGDAFGGGEGREALASARQGKRPLYRRPLWLLGTCLGTVINSLLSIISLDFASAAVVTPFAGLHIFWNVILSRLFLEERVSPQHYVGSALILVGLLLVLCFGVRTPPPLSLEALLRLYSQKTCVLYFCISTLAIGFCIYVAIWGRDLPQGGAPPRSASRRARRDSKRGGGIELSVLGAPARAASFSPSACRPGAKQQREIRMSRRDEDCEHKGLLCAAAARERSSWQTGQAECEESLGGGQGASKAGEKTSGKPAGKVPDDSKREEREMTRNRAVGGTGDTEMTLVGSKAREIRVSAESATQWRAGKEESSGGAFAGLQAQLGGERRRSEEKTTSSLPLFFPVGLRRLCTAAVSGLCGGNTNVLMEHVMKVWHEETLHNVMHPKFFLLLSLLASMAVGQLLFLNISLARYEALYVVPTTMSTLIVSSCLAEIALFIHVVHLSQREFLLFAGGCFSIVVGITVLSAADIERKEADAAGADTTADVNEEEDGFDDLSTSLRSFSSRTSAKIGVLCHRPATGEGGAWGSRRRNRGYEHLVVPPYAFDESDDDRKQTRGEEARLESEEFEASQFPGEPRDDAQDGERESEESFSSCNQGSASSDGASRGTATPRRSSSDDQEGAFCEAEEESDAVAQSPPAAVAPSPPRTPDLLAQGLFFSEGPLGGSKGQFSGERSDTPRSSLSSLRLEDVHVVAAALDAAADRRNGF